MVVKGRNHCLYSFGGVSVVVAAWSMYTRGCPSIIHQVIRNSV